MSHLTPACLSFPSCKRQSFPAALQETCRGGTRGAGASFRGEQRGRLSLPPAAEAGLFGRWGSAAAAWASSGPGVGAPRAHPGPPGRRPGPAPAQPPPRPGPGPVGRLRVAARAALWALEGLAAGLGPQPRPRPPQEVRKAAGRGPRATGLSFLLRKMPPALPGPSPLPGSWEALGSNPSCATPNKSPPCAVQGSLNLSTRTRSPLVLGGLCQAGQRLLRTGTLPSPQSRPEVPQGREAALPALPLPATLSGLSASGSPARSFLLR
uniref:Uncharacterized protein LOC110224002 n=1 Tax=Phascolarctos cinereus TaxID=38626 RepID=A0A6P5M6F2_PHACI|nr:uncharacterized protein LOC110224002 [Phascolarctos cinereus]